MKQTLLIFSFLICFSVKATALKDSLAIKKDTLQYWENNNKLGLILTQNSFVNWSTGGNNAISGILKIHATKNYKKDLLVWNNELKGSFGLNKESKRELRKTEDLFEFNSTFGYRKSNTSNWYYSAKFNFRTQFTNGYKYPNTQKPISKFFAPAYLFLGFGTTYVSEKNNFTFYLSPITNKTTLVYSQTLANEGAFGVKPAVYGDDEEIIRKGHKTKIEFGTLITGEWKTLVMRNVKMQQKIILYSDYLHNYGNIDVNWEINFDLVVNKYINANIAAHIRFDDDIKHKEDINNDGELDLLGPKIQLKQLLGVGFTYSF